MERETWTVGIDQGTGEHFVVVVNREGQVAGEGSFPHSEQGVRDLVQWVEEVTGDLNGVTVATETPWGPVVESFLATSAEVCHLNPKQLDRFRDRFSIAGAKGDRLDALVLGQSVRTDRPHFHAIQRATAALFQLRKIGRLRDDLLADFGRSANRLQTILREIWPDLLALCPAANQRWLWALLERAAEPAKARRLQHRTLSELLRQHRIRRLNAVQLREVLQRRAVATTAGQWEAACYEIGVLVAQLQLLETQLRKAEQHLKELLAARQAEQLDTDGPSDVEILDSHPGLGVITAATLLGEASEHLRDHQYSRTLAGAAPVQRASGKSQRTLRRRACNPRLQNAIHHWASCARLNDPRIANRYKALRARGHTHGRALRQLADSLLRVVAATLRDRTLYQSDHPRRSNHLQETT